MLDGLRGAMKKIFTPPAKFLLKLGISPDAVTITGTLAVVITALWAFPVGNLGWGSLLIGLFVFTDALDGTMARLQGRQGVWGAFLDSTLDRLADAAIFVGLAAYFLVNGEQTWSTTGAIASVVCLIAGMMVSYSRARAEGLGLDATVGLIERSDRLLISLLAACITGFTGIDAIAAIALIALAVGSIFTLLQRMTHVYKRAQLAASQEA